MSSFWKHKHDDSRLKVAQVLCPIIIFDYKHFYKRRREKIFLLLKLKTFQKTREYLQFVVLSLRSDCSGVF